MGWRWPPGARYGLPVASRSAAIRSQRSAISLNRVLPIWRRGFEVHTHVEGSSLLFTTTVRKRVKCSALALPHFASRRPCGADSTPCLKKLECVSRPGGSMEELDIWRVATLLIRQHGEDAVFNAALHTDGLFAKDDSKAQRVVGAWAGRVHD